MSARNWLGTYNNPPAEFIIDYLEKWHTGGNARYVVGQLEKGAEGTPHIQFFLNFKNETRMAALKKHCGKAHFEPVKKNNGADKYCMKQDTRLDGPWEFGTKPVERNSKADWEEVKQHAKAGDLDKIPADIYVKHIFQLEHIKKMH